MKASRHVYRNGWRRAAQMVFVGATAAIAIVACSEHATQPTDPEGAPTLNAKNATRAVEAVLTEYRDCDGTTSIYTVNASRAVSTGQGGSKQDAITDTIENAIKDDVSDQFECDDCPGEFEGPCERKWGTIAMGGAELEDEDANCELIEGTWYCFDWVNFDSSPGNQSWAQAGCDLCDETSRAQAVPRLLGQ